MEIAITVTNIPWKFQVSSIYTFDFLRGAQSAPPSPRTDSDTLVQVGLKNGEWNERVEKLEK